MQWAVGKSQFEWLAEHPERQRMFDGYMASRRQGKKEWFEVYPFHERLLTNQPKRQEEQEAFIVDIGGNQGHNLQRLVEKKREAILGTTNKNNRSEESGFQGRLVLQDLPAIIAKAPHVEGVEQMAYSFFDSQPVKGGFISFLALLGTPSPGLKMTNFVKLETAAKVYFFRAIFHDWPDRICRQILTNTVAAMDPAASRIIIVDHVLSDIKASLIQTSIDIQMMSIGAGMERSLQQWKQLLAEAGLEIRGIWWGEPGLESVIEAGVIGGQ